METVKVLAMIMFLTFGKLSSFSADPVHLLNLSKAIDSLDRYKNFTKDSLETPTKSYIAGNITEAPEDFTLEHVKETLLLFHCYTLKATEKNEMFHGDFTRIAKECWDLQKHINPQHREHHIKHDCATEFKGDYERREFQRNLLWLYVHWLEKIRKQYCDTLRCSFK